MISVWGKVCRGLKYVSQEGEWVTNDDVLKKTIIINFNFNDLTELCFKKVLKETIIINFNFNFNDLTELGFLISTKRNHQNSYERLT